MPSQRARFQCASKATCPASSILAAYSRSHSALTKTQDFSLLPTQLGCAGGGGPIIGCQQAALKGPGLAYAEEIANDELDHVRFLRINIGNTSIACPKMDIGPAFATLGAAAFNTTNQTPAFSPYFDIYNFLLGAFVFEDVGVTAYKGAAPLILNKGILGAAAKILATESYHAGLIRAQLAGVSP